MAEALPGEVDKLNYTLFMTEGLNSEEVDQFTEMMQENAPTFGFKQVGITVVGDLNFKKSSETFRTRSHLESDQPSPNDYLGFQSVADSVAAFVQHKSTRLPLCIAIDGPWGSGKSSMMLMIQEALQKGSTKAREKLKTAPGVFGSLRQSLWLSYLILEPLVFIGAIAFIRWWYRTNPDATGPSIGGVAAILLGTYLYVAVGAFMLRWYRRRRRHNNPQRQFETVTINAWRYGEGVRLKASIVQSIITELLDRRGARFFLKLRLLRLNRITLLTSLSKGLFQSWFFAAVAIAVGLGLILYDAQGGSRDFLETFATSLGLNLSAENGNSILGALVAGLGILGQLTKNGNVANVSDFIANPDYEGLMGPDEEIEEDFRRILQLLDDEGYTLAIFIDDLDRCSPTAVHKVVEALNVFFGQPDCRCLFVLGMHKEMVATSLEVAYSAIADKMAGNCLLEEQRPFGRRFLEKIVQFVLHVPKPREEQVEKYLQHMTSGMTDADFRALAKQEAVEKKATVDRFALRLEHVWSYYVYLWHRVKGLLGMGKPIDPAPPPQPVAARLAMIESNESAKARLDEERERIARFEARLEAAANFTEGSDENIRMFSMVRPALGSNPRQYKRYFNQLRFNRFITEDRQPESEEKSLYTDAVMAAIALECPEAYQWAYSTLTIEGKERNIDAALRCLKNKVAEDLPDTITTLDDAVTIEQRVHLLLRTNPAFLSLLQTPEATAKKA
ncbi:MULTISPECIES: KAP family P-loop NTPase fold protein [Kordiimonas]|uniref:KAP family P-loop NTPase fold protein n=1 Tax=Kordiimonas TaxID=288021 RepID=UPI00257F0889|nr:P-loop NTPase fold protein [Kordiimonas sp. UBA4487]